MDYDLKIEKKGIIITLYGVITGDEIRALNLKFGMDKDFPIWRYQIWDFSSAEKSDLSLDDLRSFAFQDSITSGKNPNVKVAIIPRQRQKSGLDDVFNLLSEVWGGYESRSFQKVKSAKEWVAQENGTD